MKGRNQKILLIVLIGLTAAFVLTKLFRSPARESNLDAASIRVDTAQVTEVKLYPLSEQRKELRLVKEGKRWMALRENISARAEEYQVNNMLGSLAELKPQRIVTRRQESWNEYAVGDTTGVQVRILSKDKELAVLWVGKESSGNTFIRRDDQPEVYEVSGSRLNAFNKRFNDWRDKSFLKLKQDSVVSIEFTYPVDSGFVAKKNSGRWTVGESAADSVKIIQYLSKLRSRNLYTFVDNYSPSGEPQFTIRFADDRKPLAVIKAWKSSDDQLIVNSSQQKEVFFSGDAGIVRELFVGKRTFLPAGPSGK